MRWAFCAAGRKRQNIEQDKEMRVTLVNPDYPIPENLKYLGMPGIPLGLGYIASMLLEAGHQVSVVDGFGELLSVPETIERVRETDPEVVGISCVTANVDWGKEIARALRPQARVFIGGVEPSIHPLWVVDECDVVVQGEGEHTVLELLSGKDWSDILGITYRDPQTGQIVQTPPRPQIEDLDALPLPARDLFPLHSKRYRMFGTVPFGTISSSRGCPMGCVYCATSRLYTRWRGRDPIRVVDELELLINEYDTRMVAFVDEDVMFDAERVDRICDEVLRRKLRLYWGIETRVDRVRDLDLMRKLARAGCGFVFFGVESVSQKTLQSMKKRIVPTDTERAFQLCRQAGVRTVASTIIGYPGEDEADAMATVEFCKRIGASYAFFGLPTPFPGTPFRQQCEENGWIVERDLSRYNVMTPIIDTPQLPYEKAAPLLRRAHLSFYFRPFYVLHRILYELTRLDRHTLADFVRWSLITFARTKSW